MNKSDIRKIVTIAYNNVMNEGTTDVDAFGKSFELKYLKDKEFSNNIISDISGIMEKIVNENGKFELLKVKKISHMLVPKKSEFDFRKCALIDIIDEIKYLSLVLLISKDIEIKRASKKKVFSYRLKADSNGNIFNKKYNYTSFKNAYRNLSSMKKYNVIVECDISNFYDRLNIHRLNSTLLSFDGINTNVVEVIDELLKFWANRDSYGLPVGSNASRILAEAFLIEIDNYLISNGVEFCRFVDDYRFFAKDVVEANKTISLFVEILNKNGASINSSKTKMRDIKDFRKPNNSGNSKPGLFEIIRGYSGLVPAKFRKLNKSEILELKKYNLDQTIKETTDKVVLEPGDVTKCIKTIIAQEKYEKLIELPNILKKYQQLVPYYSDVIIKYKKEIGEENYNKIIDFFSEWLKDDNLQEYILIYIVRIFNSSNVKEKKILFNFFKQLKRNNGIYIGRKVLEQLNNNLTRGEILELKDYYNRSDSFEKRQIVNMVLNKLSYEENRPFIKDLKINCEDSFILEIINKYEKNNKKIKKVKK